MKRQVLILACLLAGIINSNAQIQTAILEQDNTLKTFYGENAFKEAYEAAYNGAVITLSTGSFYTVEKIAKSITIIGQGWNGNNQTTISDGRKDNSRSVSNETVWYSLAIEANNVRLEGLYLYRLYVGSSYNSSNSISNLQVKNCQIPEFYSYWKHYNTTIDQCSITFFRISYSENLCIKNSRIMGFSGSTESTLYIANCIIPGWDNYDSNDGGYGFSSQPYAIYKNCILGFLSHNNSNPGYNYYQGYYVGKIYQNLNNRKFYNNVIYLNPYRYTRSSDRTYSFGSKYVSAGDSIRRCTIKLDDSYNTDGGVNIGMSYNKLFDESKSWTDSTYIKADIKGDDGKPVGVFGGTGFSLYPNIPRIVESKIDSNTDEEGKLNVKVKVEINK